VELIFTIWKKSSESAIRAPMAWWQISVQCTDDELEQTEDILLSLGALCITMSDAQDSPIYEPLPGETPVWPYMTMTGMFQQNRHDEALYEKLLELLPDHQSATAHRSVLEEQNWERVHLQHFKPIRCAQNLWIVPSWLQPPDPEAIIIRLDPGMAFGTGSHPTTALCLAWMAHNNFNNQSVIDYGCGSGILSIAACKLGASRVFGVDIDPQAVDASLENSRRNDINQDRLRVSLVCDLKVDKVDLLIANILSGPLVELAPKFASMIKPGGKILLSGILKTQVNDIKCAYQSCFNLEPESTREDWVMISGTRQHE